MRDALAHFCSETKTMYAALLPPAYQRTPDGSPGGSPGESLDGLPWKSTVGVKGSAETEQPVVAASSSTPTAEMVQRAGQQRIEDRIHAFTDALMTEIRKHKAWKNVTEEVLRGDGEE